MDLLTAAPGAIAQKLAGLPHTRETIGQSGDGVFLFDDCVLKISPDTPMSRQEVQMLHWLQGRLPVPELLHSCVENGRTWLLISRLPGQMACDAHYLTRPDAVLPLLSQSLRTLWTVDVRDCPCVFDLDRHLLQLEARVRAGLCDISFGVEGFRTPTHLLEWLKDHRPPVDPVLSHGDLCLPNILLQNDRLSGFVDLGLCAVADRWRDLALCWRSLRDNTHGHYGSYPTFPPPDSLFAALGITPDREKLRYYLLLDELN